MNNIPWSSEGALSKPGVVVVGAAQEALVLGRPVIVVAAQRRAAVAGTADHDLLLAPAGADPTAQKATIKL